MIKIQCSIIGYDGKPATVFAGYDEQNMILGIGSIAKDYQREQSDGCLLITNDLSIERDSLFGNDDLMDAINAYFDLSGSVAIDGITPRLVFRETAQRAKPSIEKDGIDAGGVKYRVSEDSTCSQIAVLAICLYCHKKAQAIESTLDMFDELNAFNTSKEFDFEIGGVITV